MAKSIKFTGDELLMDEISVKRAEQLSEISVLMRICVCVCPCLSEWVSVHESDSIKKLCDAIY